LPETAQQSDSGDRKRYSIG